MKILRTQNGLTLIEILIALSIFAIVLVAATPSFDSTIKRNRVAAQLRDVKSDLNLARSEAISRAKPVVVCGSSNGTTCNDSNDWSTGWIVFIDDGAGGGTARDSIQNGGEEVLRAKLNDSGDNLQVINASSTAVKALSFSTRGYLGSSDENITVKLCEKDGDINFARALTVELSGRVFDSFDMNSDGIFEDVTGSNLGC